MCKEKEEGGLGIKDVTMFNMALLGKWMSIFMSDLNKRLWFNGENRVVSFKTNLGLWGVNRE